MSNETSGKSAGMGTHTKILIGLLAGVLLGLVARGIQASADETTAQNINFVAERIAQPLGKIFLRLVMMVVVPLVFSALILGVVEIGDPRRLGRIGLITLLITAVFSFSAVAIGVTLVNLIRPGVGLDPQSQEALSQKFSGDAKKAIENLEKAQAKPLENQLLDILPANLLLEMVGSVDGSSPGNGMLAVMAFSLIFGIAMTTIGERARPLVVVLEAIFATTMAVISFAMALAPIAVACLMFSVTVSLGLEFLKMLAYFVVTVLLALAIHLAVVYSLALVFVAKRNPIQFFIAAREVILTAFATSSSNATLPVSLRVAKNDLKIPPKVSQFVLTIGATGNQNGTALYEGIVVLFLAQVVGTTLRLEQQISVVVMAVLAGIGTAGVPGGSMPLIVGILQSIKIPGQSIALIVGVDRILDMSRTVVNVVGDLVVAACVARFDIHEEPPEDDSDEESLNGQGGT